MQQKHISRRTLVKRVVAVFAVGPARAQKFPKTIRVAAVQMHATLGEVDANMENAERWTVPADLVIFASGQIMETPGASVPLTQRGLVAADRGGHTGVDRLFCGGDCVQGPSFIVDAVAWGHRVARSIREYLGDELPAAERYVNLMEQQREMLGETYSDPRIAMIHAVSSASSIPLS